MCGGQRITYRSQYFASARNILGVCVGCWWWNPGGQGWPNCYRMSHLVGIGAYLGQCLHQAACGVLLPLLIGYFVRASHAQCRSL